jgi:hypothetical protein
VNEDQARQDAMRFVEDLLSVGLVHPCQSAAIIAGEASIQQEWVPSHSR